MTTATATVQISDISPSPEPKPSVHSEVDWSATVSRIQAGDEAAMAELYATFSRGIRYLLLRALGAQDVDDRVHDVFTVVVEAIRAGELREPARLMGYVRTVVRRNIAAGIGESIEQRRSRVESPDSLFAVTDWRENPEEILARKERQEVALKVLRSISKRDREILRRFYLEHQTMEQICAEMKLTYNQYRLLKSRAKARFGELGQRLAEGGAMGLPGTGKAGKA